mmetsp:Transcript_16178/g.38782  ORF Transcript_16178/g.38782 Transcript_16178/m.38782 type:complete len:238 (-) Transcript_16178:2391-3104(-)
MGARPDDHVRLGASSSSSSESSLDSMMRESWSRRRTLMRVCSRRLRHGLSFRSAAMWNPVRVSGHSWSATASGDDAPLAGLAKGWEVTLPAGGEAARGGTLALGLKRLEPNILRSTDSALLALDPCRPVPVPLHSPLPPRLLSRLSTEPSPRDNSLLAAQELWPAPERRRSRKETPAAGSTGGGSCDARPCRRKSAAPAEEQASWQLEARRVRGRGDSSSGGGSSAAESVMVSASTW